MGDIKRGNLDKKKDIGKDERTNQGGGHVHSATCGCDVSGSKSKDQHLHTDKCGATVRAHAFSGAAARAIESAGGRVERLPLPYAGPRPPARGTALTNR